MSSHCEIIDDVIIGKLTAAEIAEKHGTHDLVMTALDHLTTAIQGGYRVRPLTEGAGTHSKGMISPTL